MGNTKPDTPTQHKEDLICSDDRYPNGLIAPAPSILLMRGARFMSWQRWVRCHEATLGV